MHIKVYGVLGEPSCRQNGFGERGPVVRHDANAPSGMTEILTPPAVCGCWIPSSCHQPQDQGVRASCCKSAPKESEPY